MSNPLSRRLRRLGFRRKLAKAHRWASFGLGLALLVVVVSGTVLLLEPELEQVTHPELFDTAEGPRAIGSDRALRTVRRELPDFDLSEASVVQNRGAWEVLDIEGHVARVDETSGEFLGTLRRERGFFGFVENLHMCALGCEGMPGYVPFLGKPPEVAGLDLSLGNEGTWGGTILGVTGILLFLLSLSGVYLWWPGRKNLRRAARIRRKVGRYKFNYDLHQVAGMIAIPFLLMWAGTGIYFIWPQQTNAVWYALTPGDDPEEPPEFESKRVPGETTSTAEAIRWARAEIPDGSRLISVNKPIAGEPTSHYELWFSHGIDSYAYSTWPGNYAVEVDRYTRRTAVTFPEEAGERSITSTFWQDWAAPLHFGYVVGWVPRLGFVGFGLVPILLAVTGTITWWIRREKRRAKR